MGPEGPDWTSHSFGVLFRNTLNMVQPEIHMLLAKNNLFLEFKDNYPDLEPPYCYLSPN